VGVTLNDDVDVPPLPLTPLPPLLLLLLFAVTTGDIVTGLVTGVILVLVGLLVFNVEDATDVALFDVTTSDDGVDTEEVGIMDTLLCDGGSEIGLKLALVVLLVGKRLTLLLRFPLE
jgi:hypothetical protein